ncbi:hypothetical protein OROMI_013512 [Orobanche minor]
MKITYPLKAVGLTSAYLLVELTGGRIGLSVQLSQSSYLS